MNDLRKGLHVCWLIVLVAACGDTPNSVPTHELTGSTMGTSFNIKLLDPQAQFATTELKQDIEQLLVDINDSLSTYQPDSELSRLNASMSGDWVGVSAQLCELVENALAISELSDGAFDITVGPLVNLWGFGPDGTITAPPSAKDIGRAAASIGYEHLHADCTIPAVQKDIASLYIDLSAYAKGYAVDQVAELLDKRGVSNYLVEIGGELRLRGENGHGEDWTIGIERPAFSSRSVQSIVGLSENAIATSGDYRNYFEFDDIFYSHTIDPRTGYPVAHAGASVTVIAESAAYADAMATALLVLGPEKGMELAQREGIAAFYQLRIGDEIEERSSDDFRALLARR